MKALFHRIFQTKQAINNVFSCYFFCASSKLQLHYRVSSPLAEVSKLVALIVSCFPARVRTDTPRRWISWHSCKTDCVVLNVDGSCLGDPGRAGFGGLFRKGDGEWIRGFSGYLGVTNITLAELMAVYHGLKIAREAGYNRLFCYSDSKTVLDLLSKERNSFHCYAAIIANIQDLLVLE
ncbi:hypothetical protein TSUD_69330 [Trifolium subterraneum]|uniref:RNase H type-1 domain-containing protein n=1 Tax=Trifolium subterraneum TaxID=3900 RepID=A0A2Z6NVA5_TRISU|nr:hypothetical protein TSUD_69330 [Trifolium subterraneum]